MGGHRGRVVGQHHYCDCCDGGDAEVAEAMSSVVSVFQYLGGLPVTWLLTTLIAYRLALAVHQRCGNSAWLHPVAVATLLLVALLLLTGVDYATYFEGGRYIHMLLGPATVALAVPLYHQLARLRRDWAVLLAGALIGSALAVMVAMILAGWLGASRPTL